MILREEREKLEVIIKSDLILQEMMLDLLDSKEDLFNRMNYFKRKYQKYSDVIRDVNLSIGYNEEKTSPMVTLYVADKYTKTRIQLTYSQDGREIIETNITKKEMKGKENKNFITVEVPLYHEDTMKLSNPELYRYIVDNLDEVFQDKFQYLEETDYPYNGYRIFKIYLSE